MRNYLKILKQNLANFQELDNILPYAQYGITPADGPSTNPRYNIPPTSQATRASHWDSDQGPNIQAGEQIFPDKAQGRAEPQEQYIELVGAPTDPSIGGDITPAPNTGFYREDPRVKDVPKSGKRDFQGDPVKADPAASRGPGIYGYPPVLQTGFESIIDGPTPNTIVDRDPGEVNTPVVFPTQRAYQGSREEYTNSPYWYLGASGFAPRESLYAQHVVEDSNAHPDQTWLQFANSNAVTHTIGHDHPFNHEDHYYDQVDYSSSVGNEGTDRLVTQQ